MTNAEARFNKIHIRKVYACVAVTCHLHFWQNGRDFLRATVVTRGWNGYRNKSQHRKSTLEKKILPPFQQGFEPATFQSRVLGPYAWVQGRRATSKVTATSGGRLTNRYAWVPGRPTRRACLEVNLPLRVPPCKRYPEEVTELKMAALILLRYRQRRLLRRNRIFRDRTNPLHKLNDLELFWQFRFRRADILQMTNELKEELEHLNRKGALPPVFPGRRTALNPCQQ